MVLCALRISHTFLDVGNFSTDGERGVLGLAFHPDYVSNGRFFVYANNANGNIEAREYERSGASGSIVADSAVQRIIMRIDHPSASNHNGGSMAFDPNGLLYIAVGDGGTGGDNLQDGSSLLGKILRVDIDSTDFGGDANRYYHVPPSNVFAAGGDGVNDAIFAMGLRNP